MINRIKDNLGVIVFMGFLVYIPLSLLVAFIIKSEFFPLSIVLWVGIMMIASDYQKAHKLSTRRRGARRS